MRQFGQANRCDLPVCRQPWEGRIFPVHQVEARAAANSGGMPPASPRCSPAWNGVQNQTGGPFPLPSATTRLGRVGRCSEFTQNGNIAPRWQATWWRPFRTGDVSGCDHRSTEASSAVAGLAVDRQSFAPLGRALLPDEPFSLMHPLASTCCSTLQHDIHIFH
jgi:hypothetical protein